MAHSFDTTTRFTGSGSPVTQAYTCGSGTTVLCVTIVTEGGTDRTGGAPTYNGVALTQADSTRKHSAAPEQSAELWYLLAPATGSSLTISVPNTGSFNLFCQASSYKAGAGKTSALDTSNGGSGASSNPSVSVTTTLGGAVIVAVLGDGAASNPSAQTGTLLSSTDNGAFSDSHQYTLQTFAGAVASGWTVSTDDWGCCVAAFKEVTSYTSDKIDKVPLVFGNAFSSVDAGTTRYLAISNGGGNVNAPDATQANVQIPYRSAGTFSKFSYRVASNNINTGTTTIFLQVNGTNVNSNVGIGAGIAGVFDDGGNTDTIAAGDKVNLEIVASGSTGSFTPSCGTITFASTTDTVTRWHTSEITLSTNNETGFFAINGSMAKNATEANVQTTAQTAGIIKNAAIYVSLNTGTAPTVFATRINGVDGAVAVNVTTGGTGHFENTTDTDMVAVGNLINWRFAVGAGAGNQTYQTFAVSLFTNDATSFIVADKSEPVGGLLTRFSFLGGGYAINATESAVSIPINGSYTANKATIRVTANDTSTSSTFRLRVNGSDSTQTLTITAGQTGHLTSVGADVSLTSSDIVNFALTVGVTIGTGITALYAGVKLLAVAEAAVVTVVTRRIRGRGITR